MSISILFLFLPRFGLSQIDLNNDNESAVTNRLDKVSSALDGLEGKKEQAIVVASDEAGIKGTLTQTVEFPLLLEVQGRASQNALIAENKTSEQIAAASEDNQTTEERDKGITSFFDKAQGSADKIDEPGRIPRDDKTKENKDKKLSDIKISLSFADVPLSDVLNTLTKIADLNVVGGEGLSQKVTIYLKDVTLQEALDSVLRSAGYTYIPEGKILRIVPLKESLLITKVFELKYVSAKQITDALSGSISERGTLKTFSKFAEDKHINTLIIKDTPEVIKSVTELIERLDKKARQVMIEAQFVQVTLDKTDELGIDWVMKASFKGAAGPTAFPVGTKGQRILEKPDIDTATGEITYGNVSFNDFTAAIQATDTKTKVDILSNPKVAVRENEEAVLTVGDRVPIPTYERMQQTGLMEVTGYQEERVGVVLKVTPVINEDNSISMRLRPEVSKIVGGGVIGLLEKPTISTNEIDTVVTINNGKTIVLGGLRSNTITKTDNNVPFLQNIPFFGALFKYKSNVKKEIELLIFITPRIIKE